MHHESPGQATRIMSEARIHIKNLRLRTFIGFNPEEQAKKQDVVINVEIHYDATPAASTDSVDEALNYKTITKRIIARIEDNHFLLLEKLVHDVLDIAMNHPSVRKASVEVDKPHALRFADSVSLRMTARQENASREITNASSISKAISEALQSRGAP